LAIQCNEINEKAFNPGIKLPFEPQLADFRLAIQDVDDFFYDVNSHLVEKGLERLDDMLRRS